MKEAFLIIGSNYGIATFLDIKSKTVSFVFYILVSLNNYISS